LSRLPGKKRNLLEETDRREGRVGYCFLQRMSDTERIHVEIVKEADGRVPTEGPVSN